MLAHLLCLFLYYGWWTLEEITLFTSQASGRVAFSANLRRNATPSLHLPPRWTKARQRWHLHFCLSFYYGLWTLLLHCICQARQRCSRTKNCRPATKTQQSCKPAGETVPTWVNSTKLSILKKNESGLNF